MESQAVFQAKTQASKMFYTIASRCFESCPPRTFLPALCRIFLDEEAPDQVGTSMQLALGIFKL